MSRKGQTASEIFANTGMTHFEPYDSFILLFFKCIQSCNSFGVTACTLDRKQGTKAAGALST